MQGTVIGGRYRLVRTLGSGAMGAVWLAEHVSLGTPFAVKLMHAELARNPQANARFVREAQLAARIRSPHVAQVYDHGMTDAGDAYIAMEYLVGESLHARLAARHRLSLDETARIVLHVCRGLGRAHDAGLVHRDVKPENIFLAREGAEEIAKVVDFGVAKATDALSTSGFDPTRTGALLGTPFYMSPEQAQGLKSIDLRSDLWSVAVVAFECMTGQLPFHAAALGPLVGKVLVGPIPVPSQTAPDACIPPQVDAWMTRGLARPPEDRFASAKDLAEAFVAAVGGRASGGLEKDASFRFSIPDRPSDVKIRVDGAATLVDAASDLAKTESALAPNQELGLATTIAQPSALAATNPRAWVRTVVVVLLIVAAFVLGLVVRR